MRRKWRGAGDFEDATADDLSALKQLSRNDLRALLRELGIELHEDQLRFVIDAFDDGAAPL